MTFLWVTESNEGLASTFITALGQCAVNEGEHGKKNAVHAGETDS